VTGDRSRSPDAASTPGTDADTAPASDAGLVHEAVLRFPLDERRARLVAAAVGVEQGEITDERTRASVTRDGAAVEVTVAAADLTALRAGCNSWARLVAVAEAAVATGDGRD
jgi:KEOPS complex subunit Pcc1